MNNLILLLIIFVLIIISIQDIKSRLISVYAVLFLTILSFLYWFLNSKNLSFLIYSIGFLFLNLISLKAYTIITKKEKTEDLIYGLGLGDILFFIVIIPLFSTFNYILYFISGLIVSIIIHGIVSFFNKEKLIPLAGYLSVYLILFLTFIYLTDKNNYIDLFYIN